MAKSKKSKEPSKKDAFKPYMAKGGDAKASPFKKKGKK